MLISTYSIPLEQIHHLTLLDCLSPSTEQSTTLRLFRFDENSLQLDTKACAATLAELKTSEGKISTLESKAPLLELIVFGETTIKQLYTLSQTCHIKITGLSTVNHRNARFSYRFSVSCEQLEQARLLLAQFSLQHNIEAALLHNAPSLKEPGLLVMDMDSTTIEIECIDEIAALAGVGQEVAEVTELAMQGKLDFAQSLVQRVAQLGGAPETILADVARNIPLMPGLNTLIKELKVHQWRVAKASGGFTYFADHLCQLLALDAAYANELEIIDGKLTGRVSGEIVDANIKALSLQKLSEQYGIAHSQTVAMGDGANDLLMMNAAALGVAFHAKPLVLEQSDANINHSGLDCLLHYLA